MLARSAFAASFVLLVACGGAVSPDTGPGSSSSSSSSSGSSSSSSSSSSSGSSSGGVCVNGQVGPLCNPECGVHEVCVGGQWVCEGDCPPPPPPYCEGPPPPCGCPANCNCQSVCDGREWVCQAQCPDGGTQFACGDKDCNSGQICTETPPGIPDAGGPSLYYNCIDTPAACANSYTCGCVAPALQKGGTGCSPTACNVVYGNLVVQCEGL